MKDSQTLQKLCYKSKLYLKRYSPTVLTCIGAIGVVATSVMAVSATPKAMKLLEKATNEKGENLTKLEVIRVAASAYIPAIAIGASTISCIFGANILNKRQQASITCAYAFVNNAYKEYKGKVNELFGEGADIQIQNAVVKDNYDGNKVTVTDGKHLFFEEHFGEFFERTNEEMILAEYHLNRNLTLRGYANLNEFYNFLGLPTSELGEALGWSLESGWEIYGYSWVDFEHQLITTDDGLECYSIRMPFAPTADYL